MSQQFDISGKSALITGGSRGIGAMIAERFTRSGVRTYISSRKAASCEELAEHLSEHGHCVALPADVSSIEDIKRLADELAERESSLDILVNNAGIAAGAPIQDYTEKAWDTTMKVNLKGAFFLTQAVLPLLKKAASAASPARVINIGSVEGIRTPDFDTYGYAVSKAGVHHLTKMLAKKLASEKICVNAIAPGPFHTDMMDWALSKQKSKFEAMIPLGRIGEPNDIAGLSHFLCASESSYISGAVIPLDGGVSAG